MEYQVLAYYFLGGIENPLEEVIRHKEFFSTRDFRGRIYISEQGINGQASASKEAAEEYIAWMRQSPRFASIPFKIHLAKEHAFPKMTVKYRKQLVAMDREVDLSHQGEKVTPKRWKEMLQEEDADTIVLDVRNDYEWKVGRFRGAQLPALATFREFPSYAKRLHAEKDPKKTRVMMYCTGGIRCEFFSALLKEEGFSEVYQLEGGVIGYGLQEGSEEWEGNLFVFDDRLVVPIDGEEKAPIAECIHCGAKADTYYNCANMDCNALFVSCPSCHLPQKGCCSSSCQGGALRSICEGSSKPFRKIPFEEKCAIRSRQTRRETCLSLSE